MPKLRDDKSDCKFCDGKGRTVTDLWNKETAAMWEPCSVCNDNERTSFYADDVTEHQRQHWFVVLP